MVRTLACYLDHGCNKVATAEALHVHLSTVKYRLERIAEISGLDLGDPDLRLEVHLAARVVVARQSPGPNGVRPRLDVLQPSPEHDSAAAESPNLSVRGMVDANI
ncbi:MAG: helix-turn-helix domain-containing protein [Thermoleophilia bacterium]